VVVDGREEWFGQLVCEAFLADVVEEMLHVGAREVVSTSLEWEHAENTTLYRGNNAER
jgi:hypothetical protein